MSGLDEKSIWNENIILQHAYRMYLISKKSISYKDAQSLVRGLVQECDLAKGMNEAKAALHIHSAANRRVLLTGLLEMLEKEGGSEFIDKAEIVAKYEASL